MNDLPTTLKQLADPSLVAGAVEVVSRLRAAGHEAFFAGGAVRDLLLQRRISDIDVATSATPDQVQDIFQNTREVGKAFGVILVILHESQYEVATFRQESDYLDGRHPSRVSFSTAQHDAQRRDFTVNALFFDPLEGKVVDFVEGRRDLERRRLRTVGEPRKRFAEDRLRLIRAVRLAAQLDFQIDPDAWSEIRSQAGTVVQVSRERIRDELIKILVGPEPDRGLRLLLDSGILGAILPEVAAMDGVPQPPEFHPEGDVFTHTCLMFSLAQELDPALALGVLLHDIGKPPTFTVRERIRFDGHAEVGAEMAARIGRRLRLANDLVDEVTDLVRHHLRFIHVRDMRESTLKRFLRKPNFEKHLELHRLDCLASHGDLAAYEFCRRKLEEFGREEMKPKPLLTGHDLIAEGLEPGPIFSRLLNELEDRQLEERITTRQEALTWLRQRLRQRAP